MTKHDQELLDKLTDVVTDCVKDELSLSLQTFEKDLLELINDFISGDSNDGHEIRVAMASGALCYMLTVLNQDKRMMREREHD